MMLGQRLQSSVDPCELSVEQQDLHAQPIVDAVSHHHVFLEVQSRCPPLSSSAIAFLGLRCTSSLERTTKRSPSICSSPNPLHFTTHPLALPSAIFFSFFKRND